jgi:hypothetical protein
MDYYAFPSCTTILICSTTRERLEDRIWGEIKKYARLTKERFSWIPGNLIEGRQRIVTDHRMMAAEGRDFRNGIIGVACKKGGDFVGLGDFVGIKNKRFRLIGDELQLMPKAFIDAMSNLSKNPDHKFVGMGNPKETTDALGVLCEPSVQIGGWDGGIDQEPGTKVWETRFPDGVCIQLPGSDSPNMKVPPGTAPPYPFLITREAMEADAKIWGKDDWHYTMMDEGRMPRGQGSRRVITRALCLKSGAFNEATWRGTQLTYLVSLDAAYRSVGGDRCAVMVHCFGEEADTSTPGDNVSNLITQVTSQPKGKILFMLKETHICPIQAIKPGGENIKEAEDQIVEFVKNICELRRIPPENVFYDSGMRASLVQAFARLWTPKVNAIDCGGRPTDRKVSAEIDELCHDYYSKLITEFWWSVRLTVESGQFRGMTEDVCNEGCQREWRLTGSNKIEVESKEDMKEKTGRSPDLFDCLAIGVEGARRLGFVISRMGDQRQRRRAPDPWRELREKHKEVWHGKQLNYSH